MKQCFRCKKYKNRNQFNSDVQKKDKLCSICKNCNKKENRSKHGKIVRIYRNQVTRSKRRKHPLPTYSKQELIDWCISQSLYHKLHKIWKEAGYNKWLSPSCDRIDDYKPYTLDNIQLMTWVENHKKATDDTKNGLLNKRSKGVFQYSMKGLLINEFYSMKEASRTTEVHQQNISKCCNGKRKSAGGFKWEFKTGA